MTRTRRLTLAAAFVAALSLLAGCAAATITPAPSAPAAAPDAAAVAWDSATLAELVALNPTDLVDDLEALPTAERPANLRVSVRPDSLIITTPDGEAQVPLPDDRFYLSVAPYVTTTHECFFHSLTTCHGELGNTPVVVTVTSSDGEVLFDETRTTVDNGFVGIWLPRGTSGTLTITADGKTATTSFGTGSEDPTCLTTLQLS